MKWYYNLKIAAKLLIGFILVALIAGAVGVVGIISLKSVNDADTQLYERNAVGLSIMSDLSTTYQQFRVSLHDLILDKGETNKDKYISTGNKAFTDVKLFLEKYGDREISQDNRKLYNVVAKALEEYEPVKDKAIQLVKEGKMDEAKAYAFGEGASLAEAVDKSISDISNFNDEDAKKKSDSNSVSANNAIRTMIIFVSVGVAIAVALGIFISRIISNPVKKMVEAADKLAVGDVNVSVEATTKDEIGNLMHAFSEMVENIREQAFAAEKIAAGDMTIQVKVKSDNDLLGQKLSEMIETNNEILTNISVASDQVAAGARQVSASSQILSQGSTEQASSIEEVTATITQAAAQTKQNAVNANQANELALAAKENAVQGNEQMQGMVKAMTEINESSSNISKIIKVIDEIAFQTNILALNAAVEAARAGQHGKGFAVVAEEVRNLAARSADAAKETTEMIENSIKKVEAGTQIAKSTAEALNKIVDGVTKAAVLVGDIASASNEQASGITQINQAISQVAQVVQTNSATAEESAAASEELSSQAELLKGSVSKFKLKEVKSGLSFEGGLNSDMIRMIEDIMDKKKTHRHLEQLTGGAVEAAVTRESSSKAKISLEDNDYGKY